MAEIKLWSAWIELRNGFDRDFTVFASDSEIETIRRELYDDSDITDFGISEAYGDMSAEDFREELATWKADELSD